MSKIIYFSSEDYTKYNDDVTEEHINILESIQIVKGSSKDLIDLIELKDLQLDIETNYTDYITEREITLVQLGSYDGNTQFIFDVPRLTSKEKRALIHVLKSDANFYIHNAMFEYTVIKMFFGVDIKNIYDTYLMNKLLTNGLTLPKGYNSLAGIIFREFGYILDKGAQLSFDGSPLTYEQLLYGALDVVFLSAIHETYLKDILHWKIHNVYKLECKAVRPVGDMHVNGILFDMDYHKAHTIKEFTKKYDDAKQEMVDLINSDPKLVAYLKEKGFIQKTDEYLFKWSSPKVKKMILPLIWDKITSANKQEIKKLLKKYEEDIDISTHMLVQKFLNGDTAAIEQYLIQNKHDELVKLELFIPEGTFHLNFDSPAQRVEFFKYWYPDLTDTNAKTIARMNKGVLPMYKKYIKAAKMLSSFGLKMEEYIEKDGRIHPSFTQLVSTGRMSSSKPNGQNQPSTSEYRNAYYAPEGWSFVGADYSSQEILVATQASNEPGFWHAIQNGYDLHSYSAAQIYGEEKWKEAGGHWPPIGKPKTKEANNLRKASKSLSFSLFYGSSATSLAENLNIPRKEAQNLMDKYYETFPKLADYFNKQNAFGKKNHFSRGLPPFRRIRFYDKPTNAGEVNSIGRKSQNAGIQGTSADITKLAMVYIKQYIEKNNLQDKVKITLQVHDEIICEVHDSLVEKWANTQSKLMEKAADVIIPGGWLKAEAEIMKRWNK